MVYLTNPVGVEHRIVKSGVVPVPLGDHFLAFCVIKAGITTKAKPRILEYRYRTFKNFNPTLFNDDLRNVPWRTTSTMPRLRRLKCFRRL